MVDNIFSDCSIDSLVFQLELGCSICKMKIKIDQIRTYDEDGFRQRAACLCFKSECESEVSGPLYL